MSDNTFHSDNTRDDVAGLDLSDLSRRSFLAGTSALALLPGLSGGAMAVPDGTSSGPVPGEVPINDYIENPGMVGENQEPGHVPTIPYASAKEALALERKHDSPRDRWRHSPYFQMLDGKWDFHWAINYTEAPTDFSSSDTWDRITVPRDWQTEGYGHPMYRNIPLDLYPYDPPKVPNAINPVGTYHRGVRGSRKDSRSAVRTGAKLSLTPGPTIFSSCNRSLLVPCLVSRYL